MSDKIDEKNVDESKQHHVEDVEFSKTSKKQKIDNNEKLENDVVRVFDDVLEENEKIYKAFKPSKGRVFWGNFLKITLVFLLLFAFVLIIVAIPEDGSQVNPSDYLYASVSMVCAYVLILALYLWFTMLYYKNTYFAYTNKRLIVRTGIFGVDYKSLDIKNIGASDVYVSFLDKLFRIGTGSLRFGSNSSPINSNGSVAYSFTNIKDPYNVYKELKLHIEKVQKGTLEENTK